MGVGGQRYDPAASRPGSYLRGALVGHRTSLDGRVKISPPRGFDPRTVQPVAICFTDCAVLAHHSKEGASLI